MKIHQLLKQHSVKVDELANKLGIKKGAIYAWSRNGVPVRQCAQVEAATEGRISRKDLRPDDWQKHWPELS